VGRAHVAYRGKDKVWCSGVHGGFPPYAVGLVTAIQQPDSGSPDGPLLAAMSRLGGRAGFIALFAVAHLLVLLLSYRLKETLDAPAVMWPSVGLLFVVLWLAPRRLWPVILAIQYLIEAVVAALPPEPFNPSTDFLFPLANGLDAALGASLARILIPDLQMVRTHQVLRFAGATAAGAAGGALLGAWVILKDSAGGFTLAQYFHQVQIWWAGNWLGHLAVAPVVFCWTSPLRGRHLEFKLKSRAELVAVALLLVAFSVYIFAHAGSEVSSLLQMPVAIVALLVYAALRLPPRWTATLFAMTAIICTWLASMRLGPFDLPDSFARVGAVQTFLASAGVIAFALSISTAEKDIVMGWLRDAEYRYRNFVELSTDAVWRVELQRPMPVELSVAAQLEWLRKHARVVEASRSFARLDPRAGGDVPSAWMPGVAWTDAYEEHLHASSGQRHFAEGLRFEVQEGNVVHSYVASFSSVVRDGLLLRLWGVARDITELATLNERLLREQERLRGYSRQLVTAEEKARRSTAIDLHDGIGQTLAGMAMTLDVARQHSPPAVALLIEEVRNRLREVQEHTRQLITDLSPPGLYDLGLLPALRWLVDSLRSNDQLHVDLDAQLHEEAINLEMRILVFKLVRELLRNVVKHAGVDSASVRVRGGHQVLIVEVRDHGRGFDSGNGVFGSAAGFGLWSIANRTQEIGGQFGVDSAPGKGSRVELVFPLRDAPIPAPHHEDMNMERDP
jgi:signal transduction histidine kinase